MKLARSLAATALAPLLLCFPASGQTCTTELAVDVLGTGTLGSNGVPELRNVGAPIVGSPYAIEVYDGPSVGAGLVLASLTEVSRFLPPYGGSLFVGAPILATAGFVTNADGSYSPAFELDSLGAALCGLEIAVQAFFADAAAQGGFSSSNGLRITPGVTEGPLYWGTLLFPPHRASEIEVADVDLDGTLDLVFLDRFADTITVLSGIGDGTFVEMAALHAGTTPDDLAVGDLNQDGYLDLVATDWVTWDALVYLGQGSGQFSSAIPLPAGPSPRALTCADADGDGILDLAVLEEFADEVRIYTGLGDGTFSAPTVVSIANLLGKGLVIADFDGDELPDLATSTLYGFTVRLNLGGGSYGPEITHPAGFYPRNLAGGDFDADGAVDLLLVDYDLDEMYVHLGAGDGSFVDAGAYAVGGDYPVKPLVEDMDRDGTLDITVTEGGDVSILLGQGDGTFAAGILTETAGTSKAFAAGDLDGDGAMDLGLATDVPSVMLGRGDGTFPLSATHFTGEEHVADIALADFDSDSHLDLMVSIRSNVSPPDPGGLVLLLGQGDSTFTTAWSVDVEGSPGEMEVGDFDEDGALDFALVNGGDSGQNDGLVEIHLSRADGTFAPPVTYPASENPRVIAVSDVDGDDHLDLVVGGTAHSPTSGGRVSILLGSGDGTFGPATTYATAWNVNSIAVADLDGEGLAEIALTAVWGDFQVLWSHSDGTYTVQEENNVGLYPDSVVAGDLTGDGLADLVVSTDQTTLYRNLGKGQLAAPVTLATVGAGRGLELCDLDDDGLLDVLGVGPSQVTALIATSPGRFRLEGFPVGSGAIAQGVGDVDRNGTLDVVTANNGTLDLTILRNRVGF